MITKPKIEIKAMKAKEVPLAKLQFPMIAQLKFDGVRLITKIRDDIPTFYTYNGSEVPLPKLKRQLFDARLGNIMLDGEIITGGGRAGTRPKVAGMINSALHGNPINEDILNLALFDSMHIKDFEDKCCADDYMHRYRKAHEYAIQANKAGTYGIPLARNMQVGSPKEVEELSEQLFADGFEGLILKPQYHRYVFNRSNKWVKIKEVKTVDLVCTAVTPGTGKYEGMIGALVCYGEVEGKIVNVKVGSGLNDNDRARSPEHYQHKIIEVKYNSIIQDNRTGEWSLFLPRFVAIRFDK